MRGTGRIIWKNSYRTDQMLLLVHQTSPERVLFFNVEKKKNHYYIVLAMASRWTGSVVILIC